MKIESMRKAISDLGYIIWNVSTDEVTIELNNAAKITPENLMDFGRMFVDFGKEIKGVIDRDES